MDDRQKKKKKKSVCLFFILPPTPCFISTHTATHRDRRRLVFSEHRELALSVVSCLLPSSCPSLPSPITRDCLPPAYSSWETCRKTLQSWDFPAPMFLLQFALFYPALPCPVTAWGASSSWKGRLLRLLIQQCVSSLLRSSPLPFPQPQTFLQRLGLAAFLAGILGHPPMSGHLSGERWRDS